MAKDIAALPAQIQALLFAEGGALTYKNLTKTFSCTESELKQALDALSARSAGTGLAIVRSDTEVALVVADEGRDVVIAKAKEESDRDIGDAGLEILAILLYEGPSTRSDIDYIRGVNSSSTLRNLLMRGLVERVGNPDDAREYVYRPTTELLAHLGIESREKLPEYATIAPELASFKSRGREESNGTPGESNSNES